MSVGFPEATRARARGVAGLERVAGWLVFGVVSLWLIAAIYYWPVLGSFGPGGAALLAFGLFFVHILLVRRRVSAIDPIIWLPVAMLCFYFGLPVAVEVFGASAGYDAWQIGLPRNFDRGFATALLTLTAFLWGMHIGGFVDLSGGPKTMARRDDSLAVPAWLLTLGALSMLAIGLAMVGPSVVFGYYHEWWDAKKAGTDARFVEMGFVFATSGVFALLASHDPRRPLRLYTALTIALALAFMFIQKGSRGSLISLGIGAGWCYSQRVRRVGTVPVLVIASLALLVLPVLSEYRQTKQVERGKSAKLHELAAGALYEMGSTVTVFGHALDLVPAQGNYVYGKSYLRAIIDVIPNIGLTPGKSFSIQGLEYSPSAWLTAHLSPAWFASGGGYGFAMGAELYYNFSFPGVLLGAMFLGWLTAKIRNAAYQSALALAVSALFLAGMALLVRNDIGAPLRIMLWPAAGLFLLRTLTRSLGRSARYSVRGATPGRAVE